MHIDLFHQLWRADAVRPQPGGPGLAYQHYVRIMQHWRTILSHERFHEVEYEQLVGDPEPTTRRLIAFCGPIGTRPVCSQRPITALLRRRAYGKCASQSIAARLSGGATMSLGLGDWSSFWR